MFKNRKRIVLLVVSLFLVLSLGGSNQTQITAQTPLPQTDPTLNNAPVMLSASDGGFDYYRDQFLGMINQTLEDYEALHPRDREIANRYINALWGYYNGTFTEEEACANIESNSPETLFAPGNILAFFDLFRWLSDLYYYPSTFSIPDHNDERFEINFIARAPFGERIRSLSVDLITDKGAQRLSLAEIYQPVDTGRIVGSQWVGWSPWRDVFGGAHYGMCYHWGFLSDNCYFRAWGKPGVVDSSTTVRINYAYDRWIPVFWWWEPGFPGYWRSYTTSRLISRYVLSDHISIQDDDTTAPKIKDLAVQNDERSLFDIFGGKTPYIYSNAADLKISGDVLEGKTLLGIPLTINSGIDGITVDIYDDNDILVDTFSYETDEVEFGPVKHSIFQGGYIHPFTVSISNPGETLGTGTFTARVTVKDNDYDRDNDRMTSEPENLEFKIIAPDVDEAPPVTTPTPQGTQGSLGWFISDVQLELGAYDQRSGVDFTEFSFDETHWFTYTNPIPIVNEGSTTVFYSSTDNEGNEEPVKNITVMIDKTRPATQHSCDGASGNGEWFISEVEITLSATDGTSGVHQTFVRINEGSWLEYDEAFPLSTTGTYTVEHYSTDFAGNAEEIKSFTLYVDTDPPDTDATIDGEQGLQDWFVSEVSIALTADDGILGSGVAQTYYSLDSLTWHLYLQPISVSLQGIQTIEFYSVDIAGNMESSEIEEFRIDTQDASTALEPSGTSGANEWFVSDVLITLAAEDPNPGSGLNYTSYSIDSSEWSVYEDPFTLTEEGIHNIEYFSVDIAGNEELTKSSTIMIDKTTPEISSTPTGTLGENGWYTSTVQVEFIASDTVSGLALIEYSLDGGSSWIRYSTPFILVKEGENNVDYQAIDIAGHTATGSLTVYVDTITPETTHSLDGTLGYMGWYVSDVTITLDAFDATSGVAETQFSINGAPWELYNDPIVIAAEGLTEIQYKSIDNAGNEESHHAVQLMIDKTPPSTTLAIGTHFAEDGTIYVTSETEFSLTAVDETSGVASTYYQISGGGWIEYTGAFVLEGTDGTYTLDWYSVDNAGNEEVLSSEVLELVSLSVISYLTDGEFNQISFFDFIVHYDKKLNLYKLVATNPGQFYYNIEIINNWPIPVDTLIINALIPDDFVLKGGNPIHVYLDGEDVTSLCLISDTTITFSGLPEGSQLYIAIHLDYGFKKQYFETLDEIQIQNYVFDVCVQGESGNPTPGEGLIGHYNAPANLVGHQKKMTALAGYILDAAGLPVIGATIKLHDATGLIASTTTDENGFYYFSDIDDGEYTVFILIDDQVHTLTVTAVKQELTLVIFNLD